MDEMYNLPMKPKNHMALAIFTTICCCLPLGIVAIIKASKVNEYFVMQQYELAQKASDDAKKWSMLGIGIGVACQIIYYFAVGAQALSQM
jgi:16S rRNA A1518/A1519 N6-dimethyltransferase RsmA/KsgA/DIM1 with predicted DNA glycosylase/AP lyase activity